MNNIIFGAIVGFITGLSISMSIYKFRYAMIKSRGGKPLLNVPLASFFVMHQALLGLNVGVIIAGIYTLT